MEIAIRIASVPQNNVKVAKHGSGRDKRIGVLLSSDTVVKDGQAYHTAIDARLTVDAAEELLNQLVQQLPASRVRYKALLR